MPFKSAKQELFMMINHKDIWEKWVKKYGHHEDFKNYLKKIHEQNENILEYLTDFKTWWDKSEDKTLTRIKPNKYDKRKIKNPPGYKEKTTTIQVYGAPKDKNYVIN